MKIKIGGFNFINNKEDRINFNSYNLSSDLFNYFYLDGREDTLYVSSRYRFNNAEDPRYEGYSEYNFEKDLLKKYYVIDYNMKITNEINSFIRGKVDDIFKNEDYSRYKLYNNINLNDIFLLEQNSKFKLNSIHDSYIDFKNNRIVQDGVIFNPYLENKPIEDLEKLYKDGRFNTEIKAGLIKKEIENGIAPKFVTSFIKMNDFFENKKSVSLILDGYEKFKINPHISSFLEFRDNKVALNLSYNEENWFEKENPGKDPKDLKLDDIKGFSYGKEILDIDPNVFMDLEKQITKTPADKLLFKIDSLEDELDNEFYEKVRKDNLYNTPYSIREAIETITRIDLRNSQREAGNLEGNIEEYPKWYSNDLENLFEKYNLVVDLKQFETLDELKDISNKLDDDELIDICNEFLGYDEEEEEDEL